MGMQDMSHARESPTIHPAVADANPSNLPHWSHSFLIHKAVLDAARFSGVEWKGKLGEEMQTSDCNSLSAKTATVSSPMASLVHSDRISADRLDGANPDIEGTSPGQGAVQVAGSVGERAKSIRTCSVDKEAESIHSNNISTANKRLQNAPTAALEHEIQEKQRDESEAFNVPAPLLGRSTDQAECLLVYAPNLSSGEPNLQCNFVVHANFRRRCHPHGRATCRLCGQHGAVLAHDLAVLIEGRADPRTLAAGAGAHVRVFYGVASAALGLTGLKSLGEATFSLLAGPVFRMWIPENELEASRKAGMGMCCACAGVGAVKRAWLCCSLYHIWLA